MKSNRFWVWILAALLLLCGLWAALLPLLGKAGAAAEIRQDGVLLRTVALDKPQEFTVDSPNGGGNTVCVRDGRICVSAATCPDQVCVRQGWVGNSGTPIVCLPNGLVIQIKGGEQDIDAAAG